MDVDQIEAFLAIVETGSFTRAAARLHRSQPAISRRLSLLEAEIGAPLVERVRGGVRLTDVGQAFLPHAESTLAAVRDGRDAIREQLREGAGEVSLAVVGTLVDRGLAAALRQFSVQTRRPPLRILTSTSQGVSRRVLRGEATLGLRYFGDEDPELVSHQIAEEAMVVVGAAGSRRRRSSRATLEGGRERWLAFPARSTAGDFGRLLRDQLVRAGLGDADLTEVDSLSAQKRLAEEGLGVALLPRSGVSEELRAGTLQILRTPPIATRLPIVLVHRRRGHLSPAARALIDVLSRARSARTRRRHSGS